MIDIYVASGMIGFDTLLFAMFSYKWWSIVRLLKPAEKDGKIPKCVWQGFAMQFACVAIAMSSCILDGVINYFYMETHDLMIVFIVDCALVSSCNYAMLKESQELLIKQLKFICCCSDMPSQVINKHKKRGMDSQFDKSYDIYNSKIDPSSTKSRYIYESGQITSSMHRPSDLSEMPPPTNTNKMEILTMPRNNPSVGGVGVDGAIRLPSHSQYSVDNINHDNINHDKKESVSADTVDVVDDENNNNCDEKVVSDNYQDDAFELATMVMQQKTMRGGNANASIDLDDVIDIDVVLTDIGSPSPTDINDDDKIESSNGTNTTENGATPSTEEPQITISN